MLSFDRSAFQAGKSENHKNDLDFWLQKSFSERLQAAYYLNAIAYGFDRDNAPEIDRKYFKARKRS